MKCPNCGLFHPSRYQQCVSCGTRLAEGEPEPPESQPQPPSRMRPEPKPDGKKKEPAPRRKEPPKQTAHEKEEPDEEDYDDPEPEEDEPAPRKAGRKGGKPLGAAIVVCAGILLAFAGGTFFVLTRPPESDRLFNEGKAQLANGQFAFAQKTLEQAAAIKPDDPRILLCLARAYVGVDQVEKAWTCISQAQQHGSGVAADPQLSSDLANYYRLRNMYQRAADLLRPLAQNNVPGKKAELGDLLSLWGDDSFRKGNNAEALACWEQIKELGEGTRAQEADSRLASIYQKMATEALAKSDNEAALSYYNKLNVLAPSQQSFEKTSDLYAAQGKMDLAIDQLRRAIKFASGSQELNRKLAILLAQRGKELLDKGDADTGYAYIQQAQGLDDKIKVPTVAIRAISMNVDPASGTLNVTGEVWNPGPNSVSYLRLSGELVDTKSQQTVWRRESTVVDEFMPAMSMRETKPFNFNGSCPFRQDNSLEFKVFLDGALYATYPVKAMAQGRPLTRPDTATTTPEPAPVRTTENPMPPQAPDPAPAPGQTPQVSPEERTLRDLE